MVAKAATVTRVSKLKAGDVVRVVDRGHEVERTIASLTPDHVRSVYSGKPGCMCGCKGKYSFNPLHRAEASKERGYDVGDDEVNPRMVARVLRLLQKESSVEVQDGYIHANIGGREYVVYLVVAS